MSEAHSLSKYVLTDHPLHSRDSDGTKEATRNKKRWPLLSQGLQFAAGIAANETQSKAEHWLYHSCCRSLRTSKYGCHC